ncbi:hypothetical protein BC940DRAFT_335849 [Gongronella butleri]|nr:hypothetical protein BC940DRAFT_335849 [Gongronella butleri]
MTTLIKDLDLGDMGLNNEDLKKKHATIGNDLLMPATILTLCDLPQHQRYGSCNLSTDKLASKFLQAHCAAHLLSKAPDFLTALALFDEAAKAHDQRGKSSKEWTKLATDVQALRSILSKDPDLSAQSLSMLHDFNDMASLAASRLHDSNLKLKENVQN